MPAAPQDRIEAYNTLAALYSSDHKFFMENFYAIASSFQQGNAFTAPKKVRPTQEHMKFINSLLALSPLVESDVGEVIESYQAERDKVLSFLFGQSPNLETDQRKLNESMQEVLSKISQAIIRNQNQ